MGARGQGRRPARLCGVSPHASPKPAFATSCRLPPQHPARSLTDTCLAVTGEVGKLGWATTATKENRKIVFSSQTRIHSGDRGAPGPAHRSQSRFLLQLPVKYNMQPHAGACTVVPGASLWFARPGWVMVPTVQKGKPSPFRFQRSGTRLGKVCPMGRIQSWPSAVSQVHAQVARGRLRACCNGRVGLWQRWSGLRSGKQLLSGPEQGKFAGPRSRESGEAAGRE